MFYTQNKTERNGREKNLKSREKIVSFTKKVGREHGNHNTVRIFRALAA